MIGGKVHLGESTQAAAIREVYEKTGETISPPLLRGVFEIRVNEDAQLFTHVVAYVYESSMQGVPDSLTALTQAQLFKHSLLAPDLIPIIDKLSSTKNCVVDTITLNYN